MFEELQRELQRLGGRYEIEVEIASDDDGHIDRECPSLECQFAFKVHEDDWRDIVRDEEVFCPFCGHSANSDKWWTQDQVEHIKELTLARISSHIGQAMKRDADRWNRKQPRNSFITMTMKVDNRPHHVPLPSAAEPMQIKIACPECKCRYAVVGAAFFCPACGHNAANLVFNQSISGIRSTLDAIENIRTSIPDRDTAETMARFLVENGLLHAVMAFQRYAEVLYDRYQSSAPPRRNAFQNISLGSELWNTVAGKQYSDYLTTSELESLTISFQQRHLLAHTQGIVDNDYIVRSGDSTYRVGQRLVVGKDTVRSSLALIEKLAAGMEADHPSFDEFDE